MQSCVMVCMIVLSKYLHLSLSWSAMSDSFECVGVCDWLLASREQVGSVLVCSPHSIACAVNCEYRSSLPVYTRKRPLVKTMVFTWPWKFFQALVITKVFLKNKKPPKTFHWPRMKPWLGSTPPGNHHVFLKHTFWSKTRFGPLLRVFGRLVGSKINFEHFFLMGLDYN